MFGQVVAKTTTMATNMDLAHMDGQHGVLEANYQAISLEDSASLARWAWGMNLEIARALSVFPGVTEARRTQDMFLRIPRQHELSAAPGAAPRTRPPNTDRPVVKPAHAALRPRDNEELYVTTGFKSRPLRDGGGKPSWGRRHPTNRPVSTLVALGAALVDTPCTLR